tara:strand:+ start:9724 stop:10935 length:1212 start_codon:yes stop_codon:yes gene_type:complete
LAKRILIYTNHFYPEHFKINDIVSWLSDRDLQIRVVTGLPNYPKGSIIRGYENSIQNKKYLENNNVIINRLFLIPRGSGSYFRILINYFSYFISCIFFTFFIAFTKKKYDIIIVHHTSPPLILIHPIIYSLFHKTKKYVWDLDVWPDTLVGLDIIKSKMIFNLIELFIKKIYSYYDTILIGSKSFKEIIQKRYNGKIIYFPNWAEKPIEKNEIQRNIALKIPQNKFIIMYTGNIGEAQNFEELIPRLKFINKNIHWVFVGDGRYKKLLINLLAKHNLSEKVTLFNHVSVDEIPTYVSKADCLFLSLRDKEIFSKTVPAKLQSYMAMQKPILAVLKGEGAEIIQKSKCGFVEIGGDYDNLIKLANMISKKSKMELSNLSDNGRKFYDSNYKSIDRKKELLKLFN